MDLDHERRHLAQTNRHIAETGLIGRPMTPAMAHNVIKRLGCAERIRLGALHEWRPATR